MNTATTTATAATTTTSADNVIAIRFAETATAYQALSDLGHLSAPGVRVRSAVLVQRLDDGTLRVPEGINAESGKNTSIGGMVGSLVGIIGGPFGVLFGWSVGSLIGGGRDARRATEATSAIALFSEHMGPGSTVLLAEVTEYDTGAVDHLAARFDAVLERRPAAAVRSEIQALDDAAEKLRRDAAQARRRERRAKAEQKRDEKLTAIRGKLQRA